MQKQIFESQGVDGRFGIGFLGKIRQLYGDDSQILEELMKFVERYDITICFNVFLQAIGLGSRM